MPAKKAYAIACGIKTIPTVIPATKSFLAVAKVYFCIVASIGNMLDSFSITYFLLLKIGYFVEFLSIIVVLITFVSGKYLSALNSNLSIKILAVAFPIFSAC